MKDCKGCAHLTTPKDRATRILFERAGFAFCAYFWRKYRAKVVVPINNAGGRVCNGKGYVVKEQSEADETGE